jgi:hypothetical protein
LRPEKEADKLHPDYKPGGKYETVQRRRKDDVAGRLEAEREEFMGLREGKRP